MPIAHMGYTFVAWCSIVDLTSKVADPHIVPLQSIEDYRGNLGVAEAAKHFGFDARRLYFLYGPYSNEARGSHAHIELYQFMICVNGSVRITLENANGTFSFDLDNPEIGLFIPPGCWRDLDQFSNDAVVCVLASDEYDEADYIRDHDAFTEWMAERETAAAIPYLALDRCHKDLRFDLERALTDVSRSGMFIGGPKAAEFETAFAEYCGADYAVGCGNGLDALAQIFIARGIGPGDEVIVPANSFTASAQAVVMAGARPRFVDCDPDSYVVRPEDIEAAVTPAVRAVMPVHLYGNVADMDPIMQIAEHHGLFVVEDACQAHGAEYNGRRAGALGHVAAFSFYPTKNLGAMGDGGAVVTNDSDLARKVRMLNNYGTEAKYQQTLPGRNSRLDPIQAAVLLVKLPLLDDWNDRRRALAARYIEGLAGLEEKLAAPRITAGVTPGWHVFAIRVAAGRRDELAEHLAERGIGTNIHYPVPIHRQEAYAGQAFPDISLPECERAAGELLSLPLDPFHRDAEIDRVISEIWEFFE